ncbi:JmjC domain-containing protein [Nannocystis pusilla]|uniref:JmjC domain-containing protein n=1 Tax=Nannocystis pusilla TaxID=889268 RepID=UPI003DA6A9C4
MAPPRAAGLGPHHDETEIFTLQISGSKRWQIFPRVEAEGPGMHSRADLGEPTHDLVLEPGDLLYLPRGFVHEVTNESASFSLTVVFKPFQWSSVLDLLRASLARTRDFTAPLPAGALFDGHRHEPLRREFAARLERVREALANLSLEDLCEGLAQRHLQGMMAPPLARLESSFMAHEISLQTLVARRPELEFQLTRDADAAVLVLAGGGMLRTGRVAEAALRGILAAEGPFRIADIDDGLTAPAKLALAEKLVGLGLLAVVAPEQNLGGAT